jgi:elongation factor P
LHLKFLQFNVFRIFNHFIFMATTADFKNGLYIDYNGKPCMIVWFQHVKPGKGPAFVKTKLRNLENGRILENTFTAGAKIDTIDVERRPYQFLYADEDGYNFMHEETYEQIHLPKEAVENADLMKEGQHVEMMFVVEPEEKCLTCELPTYVTLEVTYTEPAVKGNTASTSALKECTLETGAKIMVPLFINQGDKITVNTTDRSYGQRV